MFATSQNKDLSWKLIATLEGPEGNIAWNKKTGALPVYRSAEKDPFYAGRAVQGMVRGTRGQERGADGHADLSQEFAFFKDSMAVKTSQQALLGTSRPKEHGRSVGRLSDQGAEEVPRSKQIADRIRRSSASPPTLQVAAPLGREHCTR